MRSIANVVLQDLAKRFQLPHRLSEQVDQEGTVLFKANALEVLKHLHVVEAKNSFGEQFTNDGIEIKAFLQLAKEWLDDGKRFSISISHGGQSDGG